MTLQSPVLLAVIGGAHGIRGECRVKSFTEDPKAFASYGPLYDKAGQRYTVKAARPQKAMLLVRFAEVSDRTHAERLNGTELFVDRSVLPETEEEDEFYLDDLIGLFARQVSGEPIGEVVAVHNFGAGDILEIEPANGQTVMIPFSEAAVPEIDIEDGFILVEPYAAGLASSEEPDEEENGGETEKSFDEMSSEADNDD
ncbi:MAG: ribosome maturation factor RimM [Fulvimarina manganoxydans]|uniref:ribosome maturation factor RimM n=1 Tax=Fulvimarina manganoxydans TaxID=937218 RepID=UPI002353D9F8|nr:ribosome maturation factor RimM [Fulvimarina manganoxydans]MCK5933945.1 ribosome maturation factor RimM [Fulvimarina manganoxydans]